MGGRPKGWWEAMTLLQRLGASGPALGAVLVWTFSVYLLVVALRAPGRFMEALRSGFCAVPAGCVVLALLFAFTAGPAGAREVLSAITTSMITFTGLVFSITIVVLQLTSSQFSPRVLRTFLRVAHPRGCSPYAGPGLRRRRSRRAPRATVGSAGHTEANVLLHPVQAIDEIEQYGSDSHQVRARIDSPFTDLLDAAAPRRQLALVARQQRRAGCSTRPAPSTTTIPSTTER